jgi:hypothetical protein
LAVSVLAASGASPWPRKLYVRGVRKIFVFAIDFFAEITYIISKPHRRFYLQNGDGYAALCAGR